MLKYAEVAVTFEEVPSEINLCINISGCPVHCKKCHSKHLWKDVGTILTKEELDGLISKNKGISCVCFMGGDNDPEEIDNLAHHIRTKYPDLKIGWYSGRGGFSLFNHIENYDYVKFGPYKEEFGPLNKKTTNQRMYKVTDGQLVDVTELFWR